MKYSKTITDPEAFQLFADETRRKIVFLLRVKEMTVSQIAAELGLTPQAVYHHMKKLQKGNMIEVSHEERLGHLIESYYRATAEVFSFSVDKEHIKTPNDRKIVTEQETASLNALKKLGFKLQFSEKEVSKLVDIISEIQECCESGKFDEQLSKLDDLDLVTKLKVSEYSEILSLSDEEYSKVEKSKRKLRDYLVSLTKK